MWVCISVLGAVMCAFIASEAQAVRMLRDFSGDAMQLHDSRMMASPLQRIPPLLGLSFWPFIPYLPAPSLTVVTIQINVPEAASASPMPPSAPPARAKFWTNRCGIFVEIEAGSATGVMEVEARPC